MYHDTSYFNCYYTDHHYNNLILYQNNCVSNWCVDILDSVISLCNNNYSIFKIISVST